MATTYLQKLRLFNRNVRLFMVNGALFGFSLWGIFGLLTSLYVLRLGFGPDTAGRVFTAGSVTWAVFSLPAGALGRRWGVRRAMIAGMAIIAASIVLLPLGVFGSEALQLGWISGTMMLYGVGVAVFSTNCTPFLTASTGPEERAHAFSLWMGLPFVTGFAGSLVGGALPQLFSNLLGLPPGHAASFRYTLLIAGLLLVPGVLSLLATREIESDAGQAVSQEAGPAPSGLIGLLAAVYLLWAMGHSVVYMFVNVYLDDGLRVSTPLIGTVWAVGQLLGGFSSLAAPILLAQWGKRRTMALGAVGIALAIVPLAAIPHWVAAGLGYVGVAVMMNITTAAFNVFSQEAVAPAWRSMVAGAVTAAQGICYLLAGFGGGYVITGMGYGPLFGMTAVLPVAAAALLWAYFRGPRGELAHSASEGPG